MDWLRQDLRDALRSLRRRPAFAALAILTLALGLGVNTVAFSAVNALIYKPFRFAGADRIGWLFVGTTRDAISDTSLPMFERIAAHATTLAHVAAEGRVPLAYSADGVTEELWALLVSPDYFAVVSPTPRAGRLIGRGDGERGDVPVVVSERFWTRRLGGATTSGAPLAHATGSQWRTGLTLTLNGQQAHVVGVMPDSFQGPGGLFEPDVWIPLAARRTLALPPRDEDPGNEWLSLIARPRDAVTRDAVERDVLAIAVGVDGEPRTGAEARRVSYERFVDRHPEVRQIARGGLIAVALVGLVLLIACFNVAGLVLARTAERRREFSVRAALGASRWRIGRQLLTEGLVLASMAGVAGLLVANWSATLLSVFSLPAPIPQRLHFVMDWRVIVFGAAIVAIAAVVPAIAPLVQMARADLARALGAFGTAGGSAFSQRRTRRAFVVLQVAGSTFLLAAALLFARHFIRQLGVDPGFDADHLAVMQIDPAQYGHSADSARDVAARVVTSISTLPGVRAAGAADRVAFYVGVPETRSISADGRDCAGGGCTRAGRYAVDGGYFDAMGIALVAGRTFRGNGSDEADAAVVSQTMASTLWPNGSAIGQPFKVHPGDEWLRVVGVAADVKHRGMDEVPQPYMYQPLARHTSGRLTVLARTGGDPAHLLRPMREAMHAIDPRVPPQSVQTMAQRMELPLWQSRTTAGFVGACGAVAIVLSAIGLFGVTWFTVHQRRREFGVRLAVGASGAAVQRQVLVEALRLAAPGVVLGVTAAGLVALAVRSALVGLDVTDVLPYVSAVAGQLSICAIASWTPARRAAMADPLEVLRAE